MSFLATESYLTHVNVSSVTTNSASVTWLPGPDGVTHYRVDVEGDINMSYNHTNLTCDLFNLTAGTHYSVKVFPVKCSREMTQQKVTFYTSKLHRTQNTRDFVGSEI